MKQLGATLDQIQEQGAARGCMKGPYLILAHMQELEPAWAFKKELGLDWHPMKELGADRESNQALGCILDRRATNNFKKEACPALDHIQDQGATGRSKKEHKGA